MATSTTIRIEKAKETLLLVNAAIDQMIQGKRITRLEVGSQEFRRVYDYENVSLTDLKEMQKELLEIINTAEDAMPTYRSGGTIPLIVSRRF